MGDNAIEIATAAVFGATAVAGGAAAMRKGSRPDAVGDSGATAGLVRTRLRGWALRLSSGMKSIQHTRPRLHQTILAAHALVSGGLFAADVSTDVRATIVIRAQGRDAWVLMAAFIALPMCIMWIGILVYVRDNFHLTKCALAMLVPAFVLAPVAVPPLDVLWLVLKVPPVERCMPPRFANFMITYGAARTLVETFLESLPQLVIQVYLARSSPDDLRLLAPSIVLSFLDFAWVFLNNVYTARKNGRSLLRHFDLLRRVGGGAFQNGLSAIVGNSAESVDLSDLDLNVDQARQVAYALGGNRALTSLDVSRNDIGDGGKSAIGDALLSSSTSRLQFLTCNEWSIEVGTSSLGLADKRLNAADAKLLAGVIKFNRSLKSANLAENDIGDEGAIAISAALESNTTLTDLNLEAKYDGVKISASGAQAIAKMLAVNRSLKSVDLEYNDIPEEGKRQLRNAVGNKSISLSLD